MQIEIERLHTELERCQKEALENMRRKCNTSPGLTGPPGATGAHGNSGRDGATGATGAHDNSGHDGATGATGLRGDDGHNGLPGTPGENGLPEATEPSGSPSSLPAPEPKLEPMPPTLNQIPNKIVDREQSDETILDSFVPPSLPAPLPVPPKSLPRSPPGPTGLRSWFAKLKPTTSTRKKPLTHISPSSVNSIITNIPGGSLNRFINQGAFDYRIKDEIREAIKTLKQYLISLDSGAQSTELIDHTKYAVKRFMTPEIFNYIIDNKSKYEKYIPHKHKTPLYTVWNEKNVEDGPNSKKYLTLMVYLILLYIYQSTPTALNGGDRRTRRKNKKSQRKTRRSK
jgi:hypothetical protein